MQDFLDVRVEVSWKRFMSGPEVEDTSFSLPLSHPAAGTASKRLVDTLTDSYGKAWEILPAERKIGLENDG